MRRKKTFAFVLLEVLIGFALVSISILPFLRYPYQHMRKEMDMLFEMQLARVGQNRLGEMVVLLNEKEIDEERLFGEKKVAENYETRERTFFLPGKLKRTYTEVTKVFWTRQKIDDANLKSALISIVVEYHFDKRKIASYQTKLIAQKKI